MPKVTREIGGHIKQLHDSGMQKSEIQKEIKLKYDISLTTRTICIYYKPFDKVIAERKEQYQNYGKDGEIGIDQIFNNYFIQSQNSY